MSNKYIIYWSGFDSLQSTIVEHRNENNAVMDAYYRACDDFSNYEGLHGINSIEEYMEEEGCDEEEAQRLLNEEMENTIDYYAVPWSEEEEEKARGESHFNESFKI